MSVSTKFFIMSAGSLTNNKAVTVKEAHRTWEDEAGTILVARRQRGYDLYSNIFIHGCFSRSKYGVKSGDRVLYTQDTGNGYAFVDYDLRIDNIIQVDINGTITSENHVGLGEKRRLWVMK